MKFTYLLMVLILVGCAPQLQKSDAPSWDSDIPLNHRDTKAPSLFDRLSNIFSEDADYHFRKVKWGWSRERVELAEAGNTVFERKDNAIVYKHKLNGVNCKLIYTFKDNKLRTAGYISITPIPHAENLIKEAVDKHGMPDSHRPGGLEEMVWKTPEVVIFCNLSPTITKITPTKYEYSGSGLFGELLRKQLPEQRPGTITYYDAVYTAVNPAFFNQLHEENFPLAELSFYEKQLTGVLLKSRRTIIPGVGTIPQ